MASILEKFISLWDFAPTNGHQVAALYRCNSTRKIPHDESTAENFQADNNMILNNADAPLFILEKSTHDGNLIPISPEIPLDVSHSTPEI